MEKISIEIDKEVYAYLQERATPFEDTPNDVLRRILLGKDWPDSYWDRSKVYKKSIIIDGPDMDKYDVEIELPVLPGSVPKSLEHTLQVAYLVRHQSMSRSEATNYLARYHGVAPQTIIDKYCRQLDLTAQEFDKLLQEEGLEILKNLLHRKHPSFFKVINEYLGNQEQNN